MTTEKTQIVEDEITQNDEMPSFCKGFEDFEEGELEECLEKENVKFFTDPGVYDVKVVELEFNKYLNSPNETWKNFYAVLEGVGGASLRHYFSVSPKTPYFKSKDKKGKGDVTKLFMYQKARTFIEGCGVSLSGLARTQYTVAVNKATNVTLSPLIGRKVRITLGIDKGYRAKYIKEDEYHLVDKMDEPMLSEDGATPMVFPTREAVGAFCATHNKLYNDFLQIIKFDKLEEEVIHLVEPADKSTKKEKSTNEDW